MGDKPKFRIGEMLIYRGQVKKVQLEFLLELQRSCRASNRECLLGDLLVSHRVVTPLELTEALAYQEESESLTLIMDAIRTFSGITRV